MAAAAAWKRLFPEGAPNPTRMKKDDERKCKNALSFEDFAKASFKCGERYAKQALAILNNAPGLVDWTPYVRPLEFSILRLWTG